MARKEVDYQIIRECVLQIKRRPGPEVFSTPFQPIFLFLCDTRFDFDDFLRSFSKSIEGSFARVAASSPSRKSSSSSLYFKSMTTAVFSLFHL